ncbi:hypothetical protein B0T26DRAFT_716927 [Lasiosphaeria miniovina]|uniref:Uncharacterized protein n=1 Tax=Lasiosphaeria miniovina TaxID=1954250 RepID=A0AA40DVH6_9PEZI|nr:uncharacterized protein B0T26DRAFT_716927 [Lasiosphaeria miniovina]KAK0713268.1 hypothetical protein B0T26DRAFT_716927 [Lasiosphaeria miniovina]
MEERDEKPITREGIGKKRNRNWASFSGGKPEKGGVATANPQSSSIDDLHHTASHLPSLGEESGIL